MKDVLTDDVKLCGNHGCGKLIEGEAPGTVVTFEGPVAVCSAECFAAVASGDMACSIGTLEKKEKAGVN